MFALCGPFAENAYGAIICFFPHLVLQIIPENSSLQAVMVVLMCVGRVLVCVCMRVCVFVFGDDVVGLFLSVQLWVVVFSYCDLLLTFSSSVLQWKNDIRKRMHC